MRRSELASLTMDNIDLTALTIKVRGKRNKERIIPIENELAQNISRYFALRNKREEELRMQNEHYSPTPRLLINGKGRPVSEGMIYLIVERYMSGISNAERTSPHVFRHTFATHMLNEGANIDAIKDIVYKLHFPSASVFNKFFRSHTGMSPSEYRHGK